MPLIDQIIGAQIGNGRGDLIATLMSKRRLGEKDIVMDVERRQIVLDLIHHSGDGRGPHRRQPLRFAQTG